MGNEKLVFIICVSTFTSILALVALFWLYIERH